MLVKRRTTLTQAEKQRGFTRAFTVVGVHQQAQSWLAAYVVAFSIFEDRITAAVHLSHELAGVAITGRSLALYKRVARLETSGWLDAETAADWRAAGDERNEVIHAAMWAADAVDAEHVTRALRRARKADAITRRLTKAIKDKRT